MKIRDANIEDIDEIAKVEMGSGYHKDKKFDPAPMFKEIFENKTEKIFVALEDGKIIGYIGIARKRQACEITLLAVLKKYQGKGIGRKLFEHALKVAKRGRSKKITLEVRKDNEKATNLYLKQGFAVVGSRRDGKITKLKMEKKIKRFV